MRLGKVLAFLILLLLPATALATFPIDWNWNSIGGGWDCQSRPRCATGGHVGECFAVEYTAGTPDPSYALKFTYPLGYTPGGDPAACWNNFGSPKNEIYGQFYFKFSPDYTWNPVQNKMVIIQIGPGAQGAGDIIAVQRSSHKMTFQTQYAETVNYYANTPGYDPEIVSGQWYKITWRQVINTPGVANGILQMWINDTLSHNYNTVQYRRSTEGSLAFYEWSLMPIYGGIIGPPKPKEEYFWIDRTIMQATPIDSGKSLPANKVPMVPTDLNIK